MVYIGFDNGTSSNGIGVVTSNQDYLLYKLPVKRELSYTKEAKHITRIDYPELVDVLNTVRNYFDDDRFHVGLERPMVNSTRFNASLSAIRTLEATLIALEFTAMPYSYIDSKEWQSVLLPRGIKGSDELKKASYDVGKRLFPLANIKKDADGLLIAEHMRRKDLR